jgi:hypothetical protein
MIIDAWWIDNPKMAGEAVVKPESVPKFEAIKRE